MLTWISHSLKETLKNTLTSGVYFMGPAKQAGSN